LLDSIPTQLPDDYVTWVNVAEKPDDLHMIRASTNKSVPNGSGQWVEQMVSKHHLESTLKSPGRPMKVG